MTKLKNLLLSNKFLISVFLILIIYLIINFYIFPNKSNYSINQTQLDGYILDYKVNDDYLNITLKAKEKVIIKYYFKNLEEKNIFLSNIKLGRKIKVKGSLKEPSSNIIFNLFNYREYLKSKNIYYIMNADNIAFQNNNIDWLYKIKNYIIFKIEKKPKAVEYYYAFILGEKNYINKDIYNAYQKIGITHLFAISGMHINLFVGLLEKILKKLNINKTVQEVLLVLFLLFYMFLTNYVASCLRAVCFYIFSILNKNLRLDLSRKKVLLYTGIFLAFLNPNIVKDIGFLYSFTATLGLIMIANRLYYKKSIKKLLYTSFYATLFTLPITIFSFYEFNPLSIINNLVFVPLISYIVYPLCMISLFIPFLNTLFSYTIQIMQNLALFMNIFTVSIVMGKIKFTFIFIYYFILLMAVIKRNFKYYLYLGILLIIVKLLPFLDSSLYIYFLDVGQGDSILIKDKFAQNTILIDTGGQFSYNDYHLASNTISFLKSMGTSTIDYLIITHGDFDHMGEAIYLVENFNVKNVVFNNDDFNDLELNLIKVLNENNIKYYQNVNYINLYNNKLYFLNNTIYDNENDNSNVIYFNSNQFKLLFMADVGIKVEEQLIYQYNLKNIDILKVGHHGSKTSTSSNFIKEIEPKYSIISVGKNNRYNHPDKEVLKKLENSKIYRTDVNGSIMFKLKNNKLKIKTIS